MSWHHTMRAGLVVLISTQLVGWSETAAVASTAVGAATGGQAGAGAAYNEVNNNYLLHNRLIDEEGELRKLKARKKQSDCDKACNDRIKELETLDAQRDKEIQAPSFPTYTRQEQVYGEVEEQRGEAEKQKAKLITQREGLITQQRDLITQQRDLERKKSELLEEGLESDSSQIKRIKSEVKSLDGKIEGLSTRVQGMTQKVEGVSVEVKKQDKAIEDAMQYLKAQAKEGFANGEQFLKDFYQQRTEMYPNEAGRYKLELDSLLKQYRQEQKKKGKK